MSALLDAPDLDTALARILLSTQRLPLAMLQNALTLTRQRRERGGPTLARALVSTGTMPEAEVLHYVQTLSFGAAPGLAEAATAAMPPRAARPPAAPDDETVDLRSPAHSYDTTDGERAGEERWRAGARVGDYRLVERLGAGGMGAVYLAERAGGGERYAIKALSEQADAEMVTRFAREAEVQAILSRHPNLVRIHASGHAAGKHYIVMDLLEGGDLSQRMAAGALPPEEAAAIVRDVAKGLAYVHANGILHRDIKPANIMFDREGTPKLVDFGLAKVLGGDRLTVTGQAMGTPVYMAPEQVEGRHRDQDERTDVYGLGAVLYHLLTGEVPFRGTTWTEVFMNVLTEEPRTPSAVAPGLPPALEAVCLQAMRKDAAERYHSARAFAEALDAALGPGGGPADASPRSRRDRSRTPLLVAIALTALLTLATLGYALFGIQPAPPPAPLRRRPPPQRRPRRRSTSRRRPPSPRGPRARSARSSPTRTTPSPTGSPTACATCGPRPSPATRPPWSCGSSSSVGTNPGSWVPSTLVPHLQHNSNSPPIRSPHWPQVQSGLASERAGDVSASSCWSTSRAASISASATCNFTPPKAVPTYHNVLPTLSSATKHGIPSASRRLRAMLATVGSPNVATLIRSIVQSPAVRDA